jgi:hypothetical protein
VSTHAASPGSIDGHPPWPGAGAHRVPAPYERAVSVFPPGYTTKDATDVTNGRPERSQSRPVPDQRGCGRDDWQRPRRDRVADRSLGSALDRRSSAPSFLGVGTLFALDLGHYRCPMTNRTSRRGVLAALVVVGLLLASVLIGGLGARSAAQGDAGRGTTTSAESSPAARHRPADLAGPADRGGRLARSPGPWSGQLRLPWPCPGSSPPPVSAWPPPAGRSPPCRPPTTASLSSLAGDHPLV